MWERGAELPVPFWGAVVVFHALRAAMTGKLSLGKSWEIGLVRHVVDFEFDGFLC